MEKKGTGKSTYQGKSQLSCEIVRKKRKKKSWKNVK